MSGKYRRMVTRKKRTFNSRVRTAVLKTAETKYHIGGGDSFSLYHDRGDSVAPAIGTTQGSFLFDPWNLISQGTGARNRIGDEIYPRGMSMRLSVYNADDRPGLFYRIIVVKLNRYLNGVATTAGNFDLFDASGSNDTVCGIIKDDQGVKVLYDKTFKVAGQVGWGASGARKNRLFKKLWIRPKKGAKIVYSGANAIVTGKQIGRAHV